MKNTLTSLFVVGFASGLLLCSCATSPQSSPSGSASRTDAWKVADAESTGEPVGQTLEKRNGAPRTAREIENLTIGEVIRMEEPNTANLYDNSRYDFPITVNSRVEGWIDYFTGRGRPHMERYLGRSSRYIPGMKQVLKNSGLPEDLVYLALIESGFNLRAKSRAKAVGPWQFMKATGKRYGLRVDSWVDERRDPIRSTVAAANYLKDLYLMFESWYLAASAYNAGEYKILRAIESLKTNNYWRISETRLLRKETKDYIPKLIAAAIIAKNPEKYGFEDVAYLDPLEFESVTLDFPASLSQLAQVMDVPLDDLQELNPHYTRDRIPPSGGPYEVRLPVGSKTIVEGALGNLRRGLAQSDLPLQHRIQPGETIRSVSQKYRIAAKVLADSNNLGLKERLVPGESLVIPQKTGGPVLSPAPARKEKRSVSSVTTAKSKDGFLTHTVRRGESLWEISELYNVTVQQMFKWNNLRRSQIQPGMRLKIRPKETESEAG